MEQALTSRDMMYGWLAACLCTCAPAWSLSTLPPFVHKRSSLVARYMATYMICARPSSNAIQTGYAASLLCLVLLHLDKQLLLMFLHMLSLCTADEHLSCDSCCQRAAHCMLSQLDHVEGYIEIADHQALLACWVILQFSIQHLALWHLASCTTAFGILHYGVQHPAPRHLASCTTAFGILHYGRSCSIRSSYCIPK